MSTTRRAAVATLAAGALAAAWTATAPAATAAASAKTPTAKAPACAKVTWGSTPKAINPRSAVISTAAASVRTGHHACFDRAVYEVSGTVGPTVVGYDAKVLAKGQRAMFVASTTGLPKPTMKPVVTGMPTIVGLFGITSVDDPRLKATGLVTRATLPFRAFVLKGPGTHNRIVVDVAHRW